MEGLSVIHRRMIDCRVYLCTNCGWCAERTLFRTPRLRTEKLRTLKLSRCHLLSEHQLSCFFLGVDAGPQVGWQTDVPLAGEFVLEECRA